MESDSEIKALPIQTKCSPSHSRSSPIQSSPTADEDLDKKSPCDHNFEELNEDFKRLSETLKEETKNLPDVQALKVKDSNKQNDFSSQFLNFINNSQQEEAEEIIMKDEDVDRANDDEVEHTKDHIENRKVEGKPVTKKPDSPGSSDKENKVESTTKSTDCKITSSEQGIESPRQEKPRRKLNDFIADKSLRIRSFLRRRPIPLKRVLELDIQCGTHSFVLQANTEVEEAVYCGSKELVDCFLSKDGLKVSDVNNLIVAARYQARPKGRGREWEHDYDPAQEDGEEEEDGDEEFFDTVKSKKKKAALARAESAKRMAEVEYLKNPSERFKRFKCSKDGVLTKIKEIDSVCGSKSFLVIVNPEKECAYYQGDPDWVSQFFTVGVKRRQMDPNMNVRPFDSEEVDYNVCSVPQCIVSRNTLGKWRLAAIDMYKFPPELPMTLYVCPEEDKGGWKAEIDLDPESKAKVVVCSLHFRDGIPTAENPHPTELLGDKGGPTEGCGEGQEVIFRGKRGEEEEKTEEEKRRMESVLFANEIVDAVLKEVEQEIERKALEERKRKEKEEKRRKEIAALKTVKFLKFHLLKKRPGNRKVIGKLKKKSVKVRKKNVIETRTKFSMEKKLGGKVRYRKVSNEARYRTKRSSSGLLTCRFCPSHFAYTRAYFQHVRTVHVAPIRKKKELNITKGETRKALSRLYPSNAAQLLDAKKKYVCAVCKSVCDLYGLFLHMKQVHRGILCQYCLKLFKKVRDLDSHLAGVHKVQSRYYYSSSHLAKYSGTRFSFICSGCSEMVEFDQLEGHNCGIRKCFDCPWCRESQASQAELESHIVNEWCPRFDQKEAPSQRDVQILYKILTGNTLELQEEDCLDTTDIGINVLLEVDIGEKKEKGESKEEQPQKRRGPVFSCADRNVLVKYVATSSNIDLKAGATHCILEDLPLTGTIYSGPKSKAITSNIKKELKDVGTKLDLEAEVKKANATVDLAEDIKELSIERAGKNILINTPSRGKSSPGSDPESDGAHGDPGPTPTPPTPCRTSLRITTRTSRKSRELSPPATPILPPAQISPKEPKPKPESKQERVTRLAAEIEKNTERLRDVVEHFSSCLFCQQCRMVSVDTQFLLSHLLVVHSEQGVAELLKEEPKDCINRLKRYLRDTRQKELMFRYQGDGEEFTLEYYRCSYCPTQECTSYTALFIHTAEAHNTKVLTCNICQNIFLNYGSLISHVCSGPPTTATARARFVCKVCNKLDLSSFLDFQSHIRQEHHFCEICFQPQTDQSGLYEHCATHEQDLMCMKCFVTFERHESFRKHLFWKHGSEATSCGTCHTPTWPHVYHFCLPLLPVVCETCDATLPNAAAYRVHKRVHSGLAPHTCNACSRSFISKSLLWKHQSRRHSELKADADKELNKRKLRKDMIKYGANDEDTLGVVRSVVEQWMEVLMEKIEPVPPPPSPRRIIKKPEVSVLDAAIRSIMPESEEELSPRKLHSSPTKHHPTKPAPGIPNHDAVQATIAGQTYTADTCWQAGIDALLAGASMKGTRVSELPPSQLFQTPEHEGGDRKRPRSGTDSNESGEDKAPVIGGLWNQDLLFINKNPPARIGPPGRGGARVRGGVMAGPGQFGTRMRGPTPAGVAHVQGGPRLRGTAPVRGGIRVLKPSSDGSGLPSPSKSPSSPVKTFQPDGLLNGGQQDLPGMKTLHVPHMARHGQWDLDLSEESSDDDGGVKKPAGLKQRTVIIQKPLQDHDYCYAAWMMNQQMQQLPNNEPSEIDKIVSNVAFGGYGDGAEHNYMSPKFAGGGSPSPKLGSASPTVKKEKKRKKKKDKKKKKRRRDRDERVVRSDSSSDSEDEIDVVGRSKNDTPAPIDMFGIQARQNLGVQSHNFLIPSANVETEPNPAILNIPVKKKRGRPRKGEIVIKTPKVPKRRGPKPKYHTPVDVAKARGVVAGTARPSFETDSSGHESGSDKDKSKIKEPEPPSDSDVDSSDFDTDFSANEEELLKKVKEGPKSTGKTAPKPTLKLKIKLPPLPAKTAVSENNSTVSETKCVASEVKKPTSTPKSRPNKKKRRRSSQGANNEEEARPLSKKMRESLALNQRAQSSSSGSDREGDEDDDEDEEDANENEQDFGDDFELDKSGPVAGYGDENDKLYCYCQSPHDDVSEMIGCDAPDCRLEWFHFECVGIMIPPEGKWYCPECTKRYGLG